MPRQKSFYEDELERGVFDKEARRNPLAFAADAVWLRDLNSVFLDNETLKFGFGTCPFTPTMAAQSYGAFELRDKAYSKGNFEPATRVASAAPAA